MRSRPLAALLAAVIALALLATASAPGGCDELADALYTLDDLMLLRTLQLDDTQLEELAKAVDGIAQILVDQSRQEDAAAEAIANPLRQAREALVLGRQIPGDAAKALAKAEQEQAQRAADFQAQFDARITAVRDLLHPRQVALIQWEPAKERAGEGLQPPDPEIVALLGTALNTIDQARSLLPQRYWERLYIASDYLSTFLPPGAPDYNRRFGRVVDIFERAIQAPPEQYATARVALAEELLVTVGVTPEVVATEPPISREALLRALIRSGTADLLREMARVRKETGRRR